MKKYNLNYTLQYENWHQNNEESQKKDIEINKEIIKLHNILPTEKEAKILDIGCGMGRFLLTLKELGYNNLKGIEIDKSQFDIAQKSGLNIVMADITEYFESNNTLYDAIYCFDVLEHLEKERQIILLNQMYKHLTDTGMVVLRIPNALAPTAMLFRYEDFTHTISYTPKTIEFLCKNSGFEYINIRSEIQESKELQLLKTNYANIYRKQFGFKDIILTPNLMVVLFKNQDKHILYIETTHKISNTYDKVDTDYRGLLFLLKYYINEILIKITKGKLKEYFNSRYKYKYKILVKNIEKHL